MAQSEGLLAMSGELSIEALKHWLQVEAELMNARRRHLWVNTFTP